MVELLIDLISVRLSYLPTPVKLLETLTILFDHDSMFNRKHKAKSYDRSLYDKQLSTDRLLANPPSTSTFSVYSRNETYGWLCQIINRFVLKDGLINLKQQFQNDKSLTALVNNKKKQYFPFYLCSFFLLLLRNIMHYFPHLLIVWIILI